MYRRRRPRTGEITFQFDSFLDVVANVMGIILRLILVAWVGAKTYTGVFHGPQTKQDSVEEIASPVEPALTTDAEKAAVREADRRLAEARAALLKHLREQEALQARRKDAEQQARSAASKADDLKQKRDALTIDLRDADREQGKERLTLEEIRRRCEALEKEMLALQNQPVSRQVLRYQTPLARTVQSEELHFEVKDGRVCFLDVESMLREIKQGMREKGNQLKTRWELRDETEPVGAFKLRYVISRERGLIEGIAAPTVPDDRSDFRFGLDSWEAVPLSATRGEPLAEALRENSQFRRLVDRLDPMQTAVTFWVYPESFAAYRQLRDHCLRRDMLVAGRPLPDGVSIASSRHGSASRGQ